MMQLVYFVWVKFMLVPSLIVPLLISLCIFPKRL